jgi:hypothetical protein
MATSIRFKIAAVPVIPTDAPSWLAYWSTDEYWGKRAPRYVISPQREASAL